MRKQMHSWTFGYDGETWFREIEKIHHQQDLPLSIDQPKEPLHPSGIRLFKIAHLRAMIAAGSYHISAEELADRMQVALWPDDLQNQ